MPLVSHAAFYPFSSENLMFQTLSYFLIMPPLITLPLPPLTPSSLNAHTQTTYLPSHASKTQTHASFPLALTFLILTESHITFALDDGGHQFVPHNPYPFRHTTLHCTNAESRAVTNNPHPSATPCAIAETLSGHQ